MRTRLKRRAKFLARRRRFRDDDGTVIIMSVLTALRATITRKEVFQILHAAFLIPMWSLSGLRKTWAHPDVPQVVQDYLSKWDRTYEVRSPAVAKRLLEKGWVEMKKGHLRPPLDVSNRQAKKSLHRAIQHMKNAREWGPSHTRRAYGDIVALGRRQQLETAAALRNHPSYADAVREHERRHAEIIAVDDYARHVRAVISLARDLEINLSLLPTLNDEGIIGGDI